MDLLSVKRPSDKVISRLRNGHAVRLMKGTGLDLMMKPHKISQMMKKFAIGKGVQLSLDPDELSQNRSVSGSGIFGKKADKAFKKAGIKKAVYKVGAALKPLAKEALGAAEMAAMSYGVPPSIASKIGATANQYLDDPKSLQGKKGLKELGKRGLSVASDLAEYGAEYAGIDPAQIAEVKAGIKQAKEMRKSAKSMGSMSAPSMGSMRESASNAAADALVARIKARYPTAGQGLYAGRGLGMGMGSDDECGCKSRCGCGMLGYGLMKSVKPLRRVVDRGIQGSKSLILGGALPPALQSQPYSENYQFQFTIPTGMK